jgi:ribosomal protein S18 acetylase RimI-like enzyme
VSGRPAVGVGPRDLPAPGADLDVRMANAWPAVEVQERSGWRLRWSDGVTRRACSALAVGAGEHLTELVAAAETFYAERHAPATVQVSTASAPATLTSFLGERGYRAEARTFVGRAATDDVVASTQPGTWSTTVADDVGDAWFDVYWSVESTRGRSAHQAEVCRTRLLAPVHPARFVAAHDGDALVASGQIVVEDGWAGIQCMATRGPARRRGAATAVLHRLAREARAAGVANLYLAVMAENTAARALYGRAGFTATHEYCYYVRPLADGGSGP